MRVTLNSPNVLEPHSEQEGMGWVLAKIVDEETLVVEIDGYAATSIDTTSTPAVNERWTIIKTIRPRYLAGATVKILETEMSRSKNDIKVSLVSALLPIPRNANFSRTFYVRRSHLAQKV